MDKYQDREEAGKILAKSLAIYANQNDVLVLALPRGGVPVAFEIAKALHTPLDVFIVRKLGVPGHKELAMGAIASGNNIIFNQDIIYELQISHDAIQAVIDQEEKELKRREIAYRGNRPFPTLRNKKIILVDDGIATGATIRAAIKAIQQLHPAKLIIAVPVAAIETVDAIAQTVDEFICPLQPIHFYAVGAWYNDFTQTEDEDVHALLKKAKSFSKE